MAEAGRDLGTDYLHCSLHSCNGISVTLNASQSHGRRDIWSLAGYTLDKHCGSNCGCRGVCFYPNGWTRNDRSKVIRTLASNGCPDASGWLVLHVCDPATTVNSLWLSKFRCWFDVDSLSGLPSGNNARNGSGGIAFRDAGEFRVTGNENRRCLASDGGVDVNGIAGWHCYLVSTLSPVPSASTRRKGAKNT